MFVNSAVIAGKEAFREFMVHYTGVYGGSLLLIEESMLNRTGITGDFWP